MKTANIATYAQIEAAARAIWERRSRGGNWLARMSWYRADPAQKFEAKQRGVHPDCFDDNSDIDQAFADARLALASAAYIAK